MSGSVGADFDGRAPGTSGDRFPAPPDPLLPISPPSGDQNNRMAAKGAGRPDKFYGELLKYNPLNDPAIFVHL